MVQKCNMLNLRLDGVSTVMKNMEKYGNFNCGFAHLKKVIKMVNLQWCLYKM